MSAPPVQDRPSVIPIEKSSHDLWNTALNTLSVELRNSLDVTRASHAYIISRALEEAKEKKQVCVQKCWTLKKRNGETIILRDVIEKIIVWVEKFIAVGDAAIQYDPSHAAPAWAAFRFVLQVKTTILSYDGLLIDSYEVAVNDKKAFGKTVENLEAVSHLITRYAILEELYLHRISTARDKLEDMVVRLYAEILTFLARVRKYFQTSAKIRFVKSIFRFSEDEQMTKINFCDDQVSRLIEVFTVDIQMETAKEVASMHALLTSLNEPIKRVVDHTSISAQVLNDSQRLQLLHWLSPVPFSSHHKRHSERRIPSSGRWLLDHDQYLRWRNTSSSSIFLLHGIIGSGKTSLASAVVDSFLREYSGQASSAPMAYFYCTRNSAEAERSNPDEIMRSILRQLTVRHESSFITQEGVFQEYERRQAVAKVDGFEITRLRVADCVRLILETTADNPATIVVDAVDEIEPSSRHVLLSALIQIIQDSQSVVKVFVTSRDDSNLLAILSDSDAVALRIKGEYNRKDMEDFVCQEVSFAIQNRRLLNGNISESLRQELMDVLVAGAGEMFILIVRQIENLCRLKTEADVRSAMRALPTTTLNELYEEDFTRLSKLGQHTRSYAVQIFSMLLCAQEALSPETIIQAMANRVSQQGETLDLASMIEICLNLVIVDSELNVLRFAHISFQDFLETRAEFTPNSIHSVVATSCLDSCLEGLPRGMETNLSPKNDFRHYSAVYWAEHCKITIASGANHSITSTMMEFVFDEGDVALSFIDWVQEVNKFINKLPNDHALAKALRSVIHSGSSPLFTACMFGLTPIIDDLAHVIEYDWNQKNDSGQSALYLAAVAGHETIVQRLLQHKAFVNISGGKFGRPLHAACFSGHSSIVKLLLDHNADPKLEPRSAFEYALLAGHGDIALLLLESKYDVTNQAEYDSILQQAAETGSADVVHFLQRKYASLYGDLGSSQCRAVEVAIFKGRMGVVERYMQRLSDPKIDMPKDAIATAALGGQDSMISLLAEQGMDLDHEGVFGTPLRAASITCHESTVRLLLRLGANLCVSGSFGEPLQAAAMRGHETITRLLLSHGADVNSKGGLYGTALQAAAHRGHQNIVELLLDAGAYVHQEGFSHDAFHAASEGGHEGIVRLLIEKGFKSYHTLPDRCLGRRIPTENLLREESPSRCHKPKHSQDFQPESKDWRVRASVTDFSHVIETMRGAITSKPETIQSSRGRIEPPLYADKVYELRVAATNGYNTVVGLLLGQLSRMDIPLTEVTAVFKEACGNGHEKMVNQLLSDQVVSRYLMAGLEAAAFNGHLSIVNLLVSHEHRLGLTTNETVQSLTQETYECDSTTHAILDSSTRGGHLPVFRRAQHLVVERCTDVAARHLYGEALTIAAANCQVDIFVALLETGLQFDFEVLTNSLHSVCAWGSVDILQKLLRQDTKKVLGIEQFSSGLSHAARKDNHQVVAYWLAEHPEHNNLDVDPATVIDVSANGFLGVLNPLIHHIRRKDSFERILSQCLQVASKEGHNEVVEYLIEKGADVNTVIDFGSDLFYDRYRYTQDKYGCTRKLSALQAALIGFDRFSGNKAYDTEQTRASASSQKQTIKLLLEKGADPNRTNGYEKYPLDIAAAYCTVETVQELISSGADAETVTKEPGTALQAAARREKNGLSIIKALLGAKLSLPSFYSSKAAALNEALSFFGSSTGRFIDSSSVAEVLNNGPGAVVKFLLANLAEEKAVDSRYCLLAQMACMVGDIECIDLLLQRGMDVNFSGYHYGTVLQAASRAGNIEIVERLLKSGAKIDILQGVHGTALRSAVIQGHEDLVHMLITHGADVNLCHTDEGHGNVCESVLHLAIGSKNNAIFKLLLDAGADVNRKMNAQQHILIIACEHGNISLVKLLLASEGDVNVLGKKIRYPGFRRPEYETPLIAACENGHVSVVRLLLDHGADIEKTNEPSDSEKTDESSVIEKTNEPSDSEKTDESSILEKTKELSDSAKTDESSIIEKTNEPSDSEKTDESSVIEKTNEPSDSEKTDESSYIETRTTLSHEYMTPLIAACVKGHISVVRLLLDHSADIEKTNNSSTTPLIAAIRGNIPLIIRLLLDAGADVNHAADVTPLSEAADKCDIEVIEDLLSAGAIIGDPSTKGNALARACRRHQYMVVELLLVNLSGTQYEAKICREALSETISCGSGKMVGLLMEHGASPSFEMLRQSCSAGALEVVRVLVEQDMNVNEDDGKDAPLLHVAASHLELETVRFLISRGANVMHCSTKYGSPLVAALEGLMAPHLRSDSQPEPCRSLARQLPLPEPQWFDIESQRSNIENQWSHFETQSKPGYREFSHCEQIVRSLLDAGAEVDRAIRKFGNALHLASYMGSEFIVRQLLERMEDANVFGGYFETPLIAGVKGNHLNVVNLLLDRGIDVNRFLLEHGSALHSACGHGNEILIGSLLDHGADINAYDDKHGTALAAAASRERPDRMFHHFVATEPYEEQRAIIQLLLRHKPKVQIRECDLLAAASIKHKTDSQYIMSLCLQHDPSAVATEAVIVKTIETYDIWQEASDGTLRLVLEHDGGLGITPAMAEAANTHKFKAETMDKVTKILLEYKPLDKMVANILESNNKRAALERREDQEMARRYIFAMSTDSGDESNAESVAESGSESGVEE